MAIVKARGAIRGGRVVQSKRLIFKPSAKRSVLMASTAFAGGALAALAVLAASPAYAENECFGVTGGPTEFAIECNSGGNPYSDGINYTGAPYTDRNITLRLDGVTVTTTDPAYNAGAINYYSSGAYDLTIEPLYNNEGDAAVNTITGTGVDGIFAEVVGGNITIKSLNGTITATGTRSSADNYGYSYTGAVVNGIEAVTHGGDITITRSEGDNITSSGNGIYADASLTPYYAAETEGAHGTPDAIGGGTIDITNLATINATGGDGIRAIGGTITIKNLSTDSIHSSLNGINALGGGGLIDIWNGDGGADNPDGLIEAGQSGIYAQNYNGGDITIHNGDLTNANESGSNSAIYAEGDYGIYAYTHSDGEGDGSVQVYNYGLVEANTEDAIAGVYGRSSADVDGYVAVYNGGTDLLSRTADNARINAYDPKDPDQNIFAWDADGVDVVKYGGLGGLDLGMSYFFSGTKPFGAVVTNYGVWDFTGDDSYLTPGYTEGGLVSVPSESGADTTGGIYAPFGSAIRINHYGSDNTLIANYGTVIGQGNFLDPVIDIHTAFYSEGGAGSSEGDGNATYIYNSEDGVIGSVNTPYNWDISLAQAEQIGFGYFNDGNVDWGFINNALDSGFLEEFADASDDRLLQVNWGNSYAYSTSDPGSQVNIWNQGLLIGQMRINAADNSESGNYSTYFDNGGAWFVTKDNFFQGETDHIDNYGLIQTAFLPESTVYTNFWGVEDFENYGVISMVDTPAGTESGDVTFDHTTIFGNYYGGGEGESGSRGYVAVDTFFGPVDGEGGVGSDTFSVRESINAAGYAGGSTGIIVHKLNTTPGAPTDINSSDPDVRNGIFVAHADLVGGPSEGDCSGPQIGPNDAICKDGDVFYVSDQSTDYQQVGDYGTIRDGMFAWYLHEVSDVPDPDYYLRAELSPDIYDQAKSLTSIQAAWLDTAGYATIYDNTYSDGSGGGGADLSTTPDAAASPGTTGAKGGLWGRITGTWTQRQSTVTDPVTFDVNSDQSTYSIAGGAEFRPDGGDGGARFGLYGGYLSTDVSFDTYTGSTKASGGMVGGYVGLEKGPWFADAEVKADFLGVDFASSFVTLHTNATTIGVLANTGYRMENGNSFLEPVVSFVYSNTTMGDADGGGATVDYSNGQSIRAGIGARVGTTVGAAGSTQTEFDLLGKVWDEFGGPNTVTITDGPDTAVVSDNIAGLYGEVVGRATLYSADRSTAGFVSFGGKFGSNSTSIQAKAGLRKNF